MSLTNHVKRLHPDTKLSCAHCPYTTLLPTSLEEHLARVHHVTPGDSQAAASQQAEPAPDGPEAEEKNKTENMVREKTLKKLTKSSFVDGNDDGGGGVLFTLELMFDVSLGKRMFECAKCGRSSDHLSTIKVHIKSEHLGVRYPCSQCSYSGKYKHQLTSHFKSIHEAFKFQCPQCDFAVAGLRPLRRHLNLVHNVENPKQYLAQLKRPKKPPVTRGRGRPRKDSTAPKPSEPSTVSRRSKRVKS